MHGPAHRRDRAHAAQREQVEGRSAEDRAHRGARAGLGFALARRASRRRLPDEPRRRESNRDHEDPQRHERAAPAELLVERVRQERHDRSADSDSQVGEAHRLAARALEPARQQNLVRQRPAANVAESVEEVEEVKHPDRRHTAQSDQREPRHRDAGEHQAPRAEAVDNPPRDETEERSHQELAVGVAGGHLDPGPAEIPDHEVVKKRQAVEREAHDGKERQERGGGDVHRGAGQARGRSGDRRRTYVHGRPLWV